MKNFTTNKKMKKKEGKKMKKGVEDNINLLNVY